jgi:hypothetical protein
MLPVNATEATVEIPAVGGIWKLFFIWASVGTGMYSWTSYSQIIWQASSIIERTADFPIQKAKAKEWNRLPVAKYLQERKYII